MNANFVPLTDVITFDSNDLNNNIIICVWLTILIYSSLSFSRNFHFFFPFRLFAYFLSPNQGGDLDGDGEESYEENFWGSDFSYSSDDDEEEEEDDSHDSELERDDDIQEVELNGNNEIERNENGIERMKGGTRESSWEQVDEKKKNEWRNGGKQLKEEEGAENDVMRNVYHVEQVETTSSGSSSNEKTPCSSSRNSITSSTSSSYISSSTPTLIKYRKLSQRPKDQPPPP